MRKYSALVAAALVVVSGCAAAQSTVTLFGVVDTNVRRVTNTGGGSVNIMGGNGLANSRFGFRGNEDLGGGLKANFWLESGFSSDTGVPADSARFFGRRSWVGLSSRTWGEFHMGRDYTPTYLALYQGDPFNDSGVGAITAIASVLNSGAQTLVRADNSITYNLPDSVPRLPGVAGSVMVAAGEGAAGARYRGGNLSYTGGPLVVMAGYGETAVLNNSKLKFGTLSANYDFSVFKIMGGVSQSRYLNTRQNLYLLGVTAPVGQGALRASVTRGDMSGPAVAGIAASNGDDATRLALGYIYTLSKRTALYGSLAQIKNDGASALRFSGGTGTIAAGGTSRAFEVGVRHIF